MEVKVRLTASSTGTFDAVRCCGLGWRGIAYCWGTLARGARSAAQLPVRLRLLPLFSTTSRLRASATARARRCAAAVLRCCCDAAAAQGCRHCCRPPLTWPPRLQQIGRDFGLSDDAMPNPLAGKPRGRGKSEGAPSGAVAAHTPLGREEAVAAAQRRREAFALPRKLSCGVTVTALGMLHPEDPREAAGSCGLLRAGRSACCRSPVLRMAHALAVPSRLPLPAKQTSPPRTSCGLRATRRSGRMRRGCALWAASQSRPRGPCSGERLGVEGGLVGVPEACSLRQVWLCAFTAFTRCHAVPRPAARRIKAQRMPHDGRPATEIVELGAGPSPDAAYKVRGAEHSSDRRMQSCCCRCPPADCPTPHCSRPPAAWRRTRRSGRARRWRLRCSTARTGTAGSRGRRMTREARRVSGGGCCCPRRCCTALLRPG